MKKFIAICHESVSPECEIAQEAVQYLIDAYDIDPDFFSDIRVCEVLPITVEVPQKAFILKTRE